MYWTGWTNWGSPTPPPQTLSTYGGGGGSAADAVAVRVRPPPPLLLLHNSRRPLTAAVLFWRPFALLTVSSRVGGSLRALAGERSRPRELWRSLVVRLFLAPATRRSFIESRKRSPRALERSRGANTVAEVSAGANSNAPIRTAEYLMGGLACPYKSAQ